LNAWIVDKVVPGVLIVGTFWKRNVGNAVINTNDCVPFENRPTRATVIQRTRTTFIKWITINHLQRLQKDIHHGHQEYQSFLAAEFSGGR
jgi:hypothetical protein